MSTEVLAAGRAGHGELLQAFDRLRREVAQRVEGNLGMFAGFDRLRLTPTSDVPEVPVFVQVSVARRLEGSHCVDFVAMAFEANLDHDRWRQGGVLVLAQGHGRTLSLQRSAHHVC